ncbi:hypothetical protein B0G81_2398 [Paraburkholderia sp. BL6665CI2N2]|uniref:hypothetical protein n=1 Tax=Paraburkholderia sp. BL6665CI2N2 TaxID=1938806 RepID=UPI00106470B2|nr:hypothetical protein [Paraburkholderia sp. BL6665CI2N2]TDY22111.1 hypothetical protein B0G81_2398 [Paraburkholderia sp. BL6665CI2N2]
MNDISRVRFEALAAYCRRPETALMAEEVRWLEAYDEALLVVVIRDLSDDDYAAILLARDRKERYRWVQMTKFLATVDDVIQAAAPTVESVYRNLDAERGQGDEKGKPVDFFTPVRAVQRLSPEFVAMTTQEDYSPALEIAKPMMRWHEDADGNFIEQFQTTGFDSRMWELYLFATLVEGGYTIDRESAIPDFTARGLRGRICIEATTVNPSRDQKGVTMPLPRVDTEEQRQSFLNDYMPTRFSGALTRKLEKRYWLSPNAKGVPLVLAIHDFLTPDSLKLEGASLPRYLYGWAHEETLDAAGKPVIVPRKVEEHRWEKKSVRSGFFDLPEAEHISAVIEAPGATVSKFNRIGFLAQFGSRRVQMLQEGLAIEVAASCVSRERFARKVNDRGFTETWIEGMNVYHNPSAENPLDPMMLPGAAHHQVTADGYLETLAPRWHPLYSVTTTEVE